MRAPIVRTTIGHDRERRGGATALAGIVAATALAGICAGTLFSRHTSAEAQPAVVAEPLAVDAPIAAAAPALGQGWRVPDVLGAAAPPPLELQPSRPVAALAAAPPPKPAIHEGRTARPRIVSRRRMTATCARGAAVGGAWCAHLAVMAADQRLRRAYAGAIQRGAPHSELLRQREKWADLRRRALRDPAEVVQGYTAIAERLERAHRRAS